ncbi:MAG: hypothetical protein FWE53_02370 [Firmicutes bacterium]|nr:hypothetical protein [Bacillota bacterium]
MSGKKKFLIYVLPIILLLCFAGLMVWPSFEKIEHGGWYWMNPVTYLSIVLPVTFVFIICYVSVIIFLKKKQLKNAQPKNEQNKSKSKVGLWLAFCPPIFGTMVWHIFRILEKNTQSIMEVERTAQQKEWFLQSKLYKEMPSENAKFKKTIWIFYASIVGWLVLPFLWFQMAVIGSKSKKNLASTNQNLYDTCIKCGKEHIEVLDKKFIRTHYDNKTIKQPASYAQRFDDTGWGGLTDGKYKPKYEVVNTEHIKEYYEKTGKIELMAIYTLKRTHHEYELTRKCPQCEYSWTNIEDLPNAPENEKTQVTINIENYNEVKKDLPHVYCGQCGGKNKGESIHCYHCGKAIMKPE